MTTSLDALFNFWLITLFYSLAMPWFSQAGLRLRDLSQLLGRPPKPPKPPTPFYRHAFKADATWLAQAAQLLRQLGVRRR